MKQLIVYDLDGTLVDTLQDITQAANHMLHVFGMPVLAARDVRGHIGRGVRQLVQQCLQSDDPTRIERGVTLYRAYYAQHLVDHSALYPGARSMLEHFKARRQVVITNKPNPLSRDLLAALGVADYFLEIIGGEGEFPKKPDPASLRAIMGRQKVGPEEVVVIGDSPVDIETGRRAGVSTVGIVQGFSDYSELAAAAPDVLLNNLEEVLAYAKREDW